MAIVIAAGVRAYFLQPFKIPTGSMQPTLFGIVGTPTTSRPPNPISRALQLVLFGRHYIDVTAKEADIIVDLEEATYLNFFTFTTIVGEKNSYTVFAPRDTLYRDFGVQPRRSYQQGETIARGFIQTGDQVFVDKMSYQLRQSEPRETFSSSRPMASGASKSDCQRASNHSTISSDWQEFLETHCASLRRICSSMAVRRLNGFSSG